MKILPDRSEIKTYCGNPDCVPCITSADAVYSQAKEIDIDTLAEEWAYNEWHKFYNDPKSKFSDFIKEKIAK